MKNKEISRIIAGTLTATVALNSYAGNVKNVSASTRVNNTSLESTNNSNEEETLDSNVSMESVLEETNNSDVTIESMQQDFESVANTSDSSVENIIEEIPDGTIVDNFTISSNSDKLLSVLSEEPIDTVEPRVNYFATFSFDGENAGKIIIIDTAIKPNAEIRYSLDGGNSWTKTTSHEIQLSEEEINSITAENDIIVGLATVDSHKETIDIKIGAAPTTSDLYKNDVENKFFGRLEGLQVSTDGGVTWEDYNDSMKFDGRIVTKVRYKSTGTYLTSYSSQFTFTEDTVSATRTYIPISSITSHSACSEQDNNTYSSSHLVDGNGNTTWTSLAKEQNTELYYSVGFDEIKFITEIEYMPSDLQKGRLKSGQIYTSFNGQDWKLVSEFGNLANDRNLKSIKLNSPVSARYVKIVATETYEDGSASGTANTYFSGKLLNFYEDSTLEYSDEPVIKYSTEAQTTNSVTATLYLPEGYNAEITSHKFLNNGSYDFKYTDDKGQVHTIKATVNNIVRGDYSKGVYLSDLDYLNSSTVGYGSIMEDKNPSGGTISLIVDGTTMNFDKGIGAHATSSLIYDIEAFSSEYTKFSTYVGVDSSRGTNGSVKFTISASKDGKEWTRLETTEVLTGNSNAVYINVDVTGYSYLKLYADESGNNGSDHSVYADARLIKADYDINGEYYTGLKTLAEYDASISSRSVTENYENHKQEILERELVNRIGYSNILSASRYVEGVSDALDWLKSDQEALQLFIEAGGYYSGNGYNALVALGKLYNEFKGDMSNLTYKKMLLATAAGYSKDIKTFLVNYGGKCISANPVETYRNFKELYDSGEFVRQSEFESYPMELVRAVMDARINHDEMLWLRDYIEKKYPSETYLNNWIRYNGYGYASYVNTGYNKPEFYSEEKKKEWDEKYGFLNYGVSYGESNLYRIWMFMEAGAICWGLSGLGMVVNEVQGIPAIGTFQPGHEAYLLYSQNSEGKGVWSISDNISGWQGSYSRWGSTIQTEHRLMLGWGQMDYNTVNSGNNTSYILLAQDALNDYENYLKSMFYNLIANSYEAGSEEHEEALNKSLECYSKNLDSMYGLYKSYLADETTTDEEWIELARRIAIEYRYFPVAMVDLLKLIKPCITDITLQIEVDMLQTESLKKASVATSNESLQDSACRDLAKSLLGENAKDLATFSFDGDNANTILINDSYADSTIQVRVSLDGGDTWETFENNETFTTSHSIKLTDDQVIRINSTDDILVGLMGTTANFTIDIKDGEKIADNVYLNDDENLLIGGNTSNLEYSIDDGQTWQDYVSGLDSDTTIDGNVTALFRYKSHGVYLQGPSRTYAFTENNYDETSKYIQLRNVKLFDFSSEQNSTDKAAANLIDGNYNTRWHSTWDWDDTEKYISVEFDKVRYISKLSYLSYDSSGRLKSGNVYTSLDGVTWEKVHTFSNLENTTGWKEIDLGGSYPARYVKIDSTESHWLHAGQENLYFSGRMLNFYEDTTKEYKADAKIEYENVDGFVVAKLVLPNGCKVIGESEYIFRRNGTFDFKYTDANGIEQTITATVDSFDETLPTMEYEFDITNPTNENVTLTITGFSEENVRVIDVNENPSEEEINSYNNKETNSILDDNIDEGFNVYPNTYVFTENKTVIFTIIDEAGNTNSIPVTVDWIDREVPTATVEYDITVHTNTQVKATLVNPSEDITITNTTNGVNTFVFDDNGKFTFEFVDKAGNKGTAIAEVTWIDKIAPTATVRYSTKNPTTGPVTVELIGFSEEGVTVKNNDNKLSYTFEKNGEFEFIIVDKAGNETKIPVKVDWISETALNIDVEYSTMDFTNESVTATLKGLPSGYEIINDDKKDYHTFSDNGSYEFKIKDRDGNIITIIAEVSWIDKEAPTATVVYNTTSPTNKNVIATIQGFSEDGVTIKNNGGNASYTFEENGYFDFIIEDKAGNEAVIRAEVSWIDKIAPTAKVIFDYDQLKDGKVIAKLDGLSEEVTILNPSNGQNYYEFTENGTFTFKFVDKAGNIGEVTATADWINFKNISNLITFDNVVENPNEDDSSSDEGVDSSKINYVIATLSVDLDKVEILNNDGSNEVKFTENGTFTFLAKMIDTGHEFEIVVAVDWLNGDANEEKPVVPPVDNESNSSNDSEENSNAGDNSNGSTNQGPSVNNNNNNNSESNSNLGDSSQEQSSNSNKNEVKPFVDLNSLGFNVSYSDKVEESTLNSVTEENDTEESTVELNKNSDSSESSVSKEDNSQDLSSVDTEKPKGIISIVFIAIIAFIAGLFVWVRKLIKLDK